MTQVKSVCQHLIDTAQGVKCPRIADIGQQLSDHIAENLFVITHIYVALNMTFDLRFATAERNEDGEGQ